MSNFAKPLKDLTVEELQRIADQSSPQYGALALDELQRRQQEANNVQISELIKEVGILKGITDKNAKATNQSAISSSKLSRLAIWIAIATLVTQVIFSTHLKNDCLWPGSVNTGDPGFAYYSGCYRQIDLGLLGTYTMQIPDYRVKISK